MGIVWLHQGQSAEQKSIFPLTGALFIATTSSVLDTVFGCILTFPSMKVRHSLTLSLLETPALHF